MKISIIAVGKAGSSAEQDLIARYVKRLKWQLEVKEVEEKRPLEGRERQTSEGNKLMDAVPEGSFVVVLDEKGKTPTSEEFAKHIEAWQVRGFSHITFLLGGADGHSNAVKKRADYTLSLGKLTWPHMMARAMLVEQIYRTASILGGHPYHKS